jgi:hypothetical protein
MFPSLLVVGDVTKWYHSKERRPRSDVSRPVGGWGHYRRNSSIVPEIGDEKGKTPTVSGEKTMLWHQRLGNIRDTRLQLLYSKGMVEGLFNFSLDFDFCEHCVYGKNNLVRFPFGETRAEGILQLVHNDVFGHVSISSLGKSVYYVSFIDEFSRNTWIYFLRKKSKVF